MTSIFRTEVEVNPFPFAINYETPVLFCGSCFTENIGSIMVTRKLPVLVNPFGVVYNPVSVKLVLDRILNGLPLEESDLSFRNGLWFSYLHHTSYSSPDKDKCLHTINNELSQASGFIKNTDYLFVTFGTARVYYQKENGQPVANCHKIPAREFDNRLLSVTEIVTIWSELIVKLLERRPNLKIIFTISPVRHWKDGAIGNQQSKSILNVAVHELIHNFQSNAFYFPAFEILMDDLRDYRFYADDMLHPSTSAVEYIWAKFKNALIDSKSKTLIADIEKIMFAVNHRPFNPNTPEHRAFVENTLKLIGRIKQSVPSIDFSDEEKFLKEFLR